MTAMSQARPSEGEVTAVANIFRPFHGKDNPNGSLAALNASIKLLRARYAGARCDDEAVSCCSRCNIMFLVRTVEDAISAALQPTLPVSQGEVERCALCSCQLSRPWTGSDEPHCGECLSALAPDQNVVAYLRRRATQRPSDGLVERQGLPEIAIEYGQALLNACADEIEARALTTSPDTREVLVEARWYVNDHQEANRNDETGALLAKIDTILGQDTVSKEERP